MRGAGAGARAVLLVLLLAVASAAEEPLEDEVESAPFAIVVVHEDGWRCGGALVSLRVALSSASCARGRAPAPPADLWARAPGAPTADGARRVARIAMPIEAEGAVEGARWTEGAWLGAALDLALLELETPFGAAAHARPILMAAGGECAAARSCLAVRTPAHAAAPLRVGNASLAPPAVCAAAAPHWLAVADRVICLVGPLFCPSDWGVGVVCAGKLCGVLSRSARGAGEGPAGCGTTHAAQHVPSWRAFVHCAQTRQHCGRDSCASVCSERMLLEDPVGGPGPGTAGAPEPGGTKGPGPDTAGRSRPRTSVEDDEEAETKAIVTPYSTPLTRDDMKTESGRQTPVNADADASGRRAGTAPGEPTRTPVPAKDTQPSGGRMAHFEFEPYRADFKTGEYGDNGANYDSGEEPPPTRTQRAPTPAPGSSREPEALVSQPPLAVPPPAAAAAAAAAPSRLAHSEESLTKESSSHVHRNTLAPYFCIFLFGINNR